MLTKCRAAQQETEAKNIFKSKTSTSNSFGLWKKFWTEKV
jgi:hypothetical protein